ncbi:lipid-binding SYLF domain-containing protein [Namhaeicola litoreus]|uniref:YSC84-related protein n=1 Tax=Namhaeicola litoreus TaxID=1052145 RepID=A0ABW3XY01_9FLAO
MKLIKLGIALIFLATTVIACKETKKGAEKDVQDAVEAVQETADDVSDAVSDAAEEVEEAMDDAVDAAEDLGEVANEAAKTVEGAVKAAGFSVVYPQDTKLADEVKSGMKELIKEDPSLSKYFANAYGYAIFPKITKAGLGIGGAGGEGLVFEKGTVIGKATLMQATFGLQAGGQQYREVVFFEDKAALDRFTNGKFKFSGEASAVALEKGVSADIAYQDGVAIITDPMGGVMAEASVGTQKFKYKAGI